MYNEQQPEMQGLNALKRQRVDGVDPAAYPNTAGGAVAGNGVAAGGFTAGGGGGESAFPAVKLRGLPFDVSEYDVRVFLADEPVDILMVKRDGRFSGEAIVVLGSLAQVEMAVAKNRSYLGRRYVEVFKAKKLDYYKGVVNEMTDGSMQRGGGNMARGNNMGGGGPMGGGMMGNMGNMGGMDPTGGMGGMMGGMMGLDPSMGMMDPAQYGAMQAGGYGGGMFEQGLAGQGYIGPQMGGGGGGGMGGGGMGGGMGGGGMGGGGMGGGGMGQGARTMTGGTTVLKLRGLPYACAEADLIQWFEDPMLGISPLTSANVHMISDGGRATGMAYVEFPTPQEASAAMMKNKQHLGNRYIEMFPASRFDLEGKAAAQRGAPGY